MCFWVVVIVATRYIYLNVIKTMLTVHYAKKWKPTVNKFVCLLIALPLMGQAATIAPAFKGASEPSWTIQGSAWLTAAGRASPPAAALDLPGEGWLRLTDAVNRQKGSAVYNNAFSSADGVVVDFEYATWGGSGADGFTFYLLDGSVAAPTTGASDGSLGYSSWAGAGQLGVPKGYLGVGFDEYGNFSNAAFGGCSNPGGPSCSRTPESIAVRGRDSSAAGDGNGNYPLLAKVPVTQVGTTNRALSRKVRVTVTPAPTILLTVEVDFNTGAGYQKLIDTLDITTLNGAPPATFKMGFSGGTGSLNNNHEIRFLGVQGARTASVALSATPPACGANPSRLAAVVTGSDSTQQPSGTVTFLEGSTTIGSAPVVGGVATLDTVLTPGSHIIVARYSGDGAYTTVDSSAGSVTVTNAACARPVPGLQPWSLAALAALFLFSVAALRRKQR